MPKNKFSAKNKIICSLIALILFVATIPMQLDFIAPKAALAAPDSWSQTTFNGSDGTYTNISPANSNNDATLTANSESFTERFTGRLYKDSANTTANWDTHRGKVKLTATGTNPSWTGDGSSWNVGDVGIDSIPTLADLDNDGDYDLLIGRSTGDAVAYQNTGNASSPTWTANPGWNAPDIGSRSYPSFADLDNDGDYDLLIGRFTGDAVAYQNTGNASSPTWTANPSWNAPDMGLGSHPALVYLDNDNDYDLLLHETTDETGGVDILYAYAFTNSGSATAPTWTAQSSWNTPATAGSGNSSMAIADLDNDLDFDYLIGSSGNPSEIVMGYKNTGSVNSPVWAAAATWDKTTSQFVPKPAVADLDDDGDYDMLYGDVAGLSYGVKNESSFTFQTPKVAQSLTVDSTSSTITAATLTTSHTLNGQTITYEMSANGGTNWETVTSGTQKTFSNPGSDLRWKATLSTSNTAVTPSIQQIDVSYVTGYASSGNLVSQAIAPTGLYDWGALTFTKTTPGGTTLTVDVLRSSDNAVLATDVASGTDLSTLTYGGQSLNSWNSLKLKANFNGPGSNTSTLSDWNVSYNYDVTNPTDPSNLAAGNATTTSIPLSWTGSTDSESGLAGYKIERAFDSGGSPGSFSQIDTSASNSYTHNSLTPNTKYWYRVKAYDNVGNDSTSYTSNVSKTTLSDPPTLPVATDASFTDKINVSWNASATASSYKVYRDGVSGSGTLVYNSNGTSFDDSITGSHTYYIYSVNSEGVENSSYITDSGSTAAAQAPSPSDQTAPSVSFNSPNEGTFVKGFINISATAADNVGVTSVSFFDNSLTSLIETKSSSPYSISWNTVGKDGIHTIYASAKDAAGLSTQTSLKLNVDNYKPQTQAPKASRARKGRYTKLFFKIIDPYTDEADVEIWVVRSAKKKGAKKKQKVVKKFDLDSVEVGTLEDHKMKANLKKGLYYFYVYAEDQAGNKQANVARNKLIIY